ALAAVERGLAEAEATGEHYYEAELCRLAGEVSAAMGRPDVEINSWMCRARKTAERQGAVAFLQRTEESTERLSAS
ncbi:MAG: hypothetical protein ACRD12_24135, partial [Acidimicrobiales bacterium]